MYKTTCTQEELKSGFKELHDIFMHCYEDILNDPAGMLLPTYDMNEYGKGVDAVSDLFHSEQDRETAQLIHEELMKRNYCYNFQNWNEGPQIRYYKKEGDRNRNTNADFWITSMDTEFIFYFRIKNMDRILEYIKKCLENVISNFMVSDSEYANRISGACVSGISYQLNGNIIWRCGCCNPNFQVTPSSRDYLYYIDVVEMAGNTLNAIHTL